MNNIIYHVDAFTSEPFTGNPAGVLITSGALTEEYMQLMAAELNLSETAFLTPQNGGYRIRFYTPETEIDLCGHATLSAAHMLYELGLVSTDSVIFFDSKAGPLEVSVTDNLYILNFPVYSLEKIDIPDELVKASGLKPLELYRSDYDWHLALLATEKELTDASPDFSALKKSGFGNLIITAESNHENIDFVVRCFVPGMGINEDPVTGSAHCALTPFWTARTGRDEFTSYQASKRGGYLRVKLDGERVYIAGNAVTIMQSELKI